MKSRFINGVVDALSKAKAVDDPFKFRIITDALYPELYEEFAWNINHNFHLQPKFHSDTWDAIFMDFARMIKPQFEPNDFWRRAIDLFTSPELQEVLLSHFGFQDERVRAVCNVVYNKTSQTINPHTDYKPDHFETELLTHWQIYFPVTNVFPHLGTSFYGDRKGRVLLDAAPFVAGSSFAFAPSPVSWHGASGAFSELPYLRASIIHQYYRSAP